MVRIILFLFVSTLPPVAASAQNIFSGGNGSGFAGTGYLQQNHPEALIYEGGSGSGYSFNNALAGPLIALPLRLLQFEAIPSTQSVQLRWQVALAGSDASFTIEKSANGRDWSTLGHVKGQENITAYGFTYLAPVQGLQYYRLKLAEQNGATGYSETRTVYFGQSAAITASLQPNPATDLFSLVIGGATVTNGYIRITNAMGQTVLSQENISGNIHQFDISVLPAGHYQVLVKVNGSVTTTAKLLKP